jgi:hypothetical protein
MMKLGEKYFSGESELQTFGQLFGMVHSHLGNGVQTLGAKLFEETARLLYGLTNECGLELLIGRPVEPTGASINLNTELQEYRTPVYEGPLQIEFIGIGKQKSSELLQTILEMGNVTDIPFEYQWPDGHREVWSANRLRVSKRNFADALLAIDITEFDEWPGLNELLSVGEEDEEESQHLSGDTINQYLGVTHIHVSGDMNVEQVDRATFSTGLNLDPEVQAEMDGLFKQIDENGIESIIGGVVDNSTPDKSVIFKDMPSNANEWCRAIYEWNLRHPTMTFKKTWSLFTTKEQNFSGYKILPIRKNSECELEGVGLMNRKKFKARWDGYVVE